jgi:flagellar hook-associated protein 2
MSSISALNSLLDSSSSANSAINLSQILEAAMGASSEGIDVNDAVSAAVSAAEQPEQQWETQESTLQSQTSALNAIQSDAETLDTDMQNLNNLMGPLSATTVASSNSSIVSGTAASGTAAGNYVVEVGSLAATDSWASDTVASASTPLAAGSFTITGANGTTTTISTGTGTSTLSDVASTINSDDLGVTATVVTDATGARLSIVSNTSGSASDFSVSAPSGGSLSFSEVQPGANASLTVNGLAISSASNNVTGAVPGLTLNLESASPGTPVTLTVSPDTSQASTAISQFVTDYNTLISAVNAQYADTGSGEGVLATDPTLRNLQSELLQALGYTYVPSSGSTTVPNLSSLGVTVNNDGTLNLDTATLNNALNNNFSDVQSFFQGSALNGFANSLDQQLTSFISPADGAFTVDLQSMSSEESTLQSDVTNFQNNVITPLQSQLQSEYSQAEIALQQLPVQMKEIDEELGMDNSSNG